MQTDDVNNSLKHYINDKHCLINLNYRNEYLVAKHIKQNYTICNIFIFKI